MVDFNLDQAKRLNAFISKHSIKTGIDELGISSDKKTLVCIDYEDVFLFSDHKDEVSFFISLLLKTTLNGIPIFKMAEHDSIGTYFYFTSVVEEFLKQGGFINVFNNDLEQKMLDNEKKILEIKALNIGLKQYKFNKIAVYITIFIAIISIVATILVAVGVIHAPHGIA
jgi:hypothetical protein